MRFESLTLSIVRRTLVSTTVFSPKMNKEKYQIQILMNIGHETPTGVKWSGFKMPLISPSIESEGLLKDPVLAFEIHSLHNSVKSSSAVIIDWEKVRENFNLHTKVESDDKFDPQLENAGIWPVSFLQDLNQRWKEDLLLKQNQGFDNVIDFLNGMVSTGNSPQDIISWLESRESPICYGGDAACRQAVELGWLVGAWSVSYTTLEEAGELQNPGQMIEKAASFVAEKAGWEGDL